MASFEQIQAKKFRDQAVWFLNGFWISKTLDRAYLKEDESGHPKTEAERIWNLYQQFQKLHEDHQRQLGKTRDEIGPGTDLDEFHSHRLLEWTKEALTVVEMREALRQIDVNKNSRMTLIEYLAWKFQVSPAAVASAPQGDASDELANAEAAFRQIEARMAEVTAALDANQQALEALAVARASLAAAEKELAEAVAELNKQEEEYKRKIAELEAKKENENLGIVARNKASNELDQMRAEDPLPLRRAKITQEAALRRVQKEQKVVAQKTEEAEHQKAQLEKAYDALQKEMEVAAAKLEEARNAPGVSYGNLWMMERELYEADSRLPTRRQKYDHSKPFVFTSNV